ncbi:hypothetical protein MQE36_14705 [Zhouia spongiae]|uniref:Uncharacterized protein n=1 Tax=Zhouia spongiae TaxID=2202721 RepID=A0ABY3YL50_9FLAO|nr:BfmA/BtgA family mobilization protein [Zhouia spongiae]UNY98323.1 hypothetical protein MQE36_14705 [Zhouia spongiae]
MKDHIHLVIEKKIAQRFITYSKKFKITPSKALALLLEKEQLLQVQEKQNTKVTVADLEQLIKKRINALIAIIRDIEKHQTKPVLAMMLELFKGSTFTGSPQFTENIQRLSVKGQDQSKASDSISLKEDIKACEQGRVIKALLDKIVVHRTSFGRPQLRVMMSPEEFSKIKTKLNV